MTFFDSIVSCHKKYFSYKGRASLSEYWWFNLYLLLMSLPFVFAYAIAQKKTPTVVMIYGLIFVLSSAIPCWMVTIRRLHDTNRTGWWCFLVNIPVLNLLLLWFLLQPSKDPNDYDESQVVINE